MIDNLSDKLERRNEAACKELRERYGEAVEEAIRRAEASARRESAEAPDGSEAYAYPEGDNIAWGVNSAGDGFNIWRGIRRPDGSDVLEMGLEMRPSPAQPRADAPKRPIRNTLNFLLRPLGLKI